MPNQDKSQKNRKAIYDLMVKDNYDLTDYDSFSKELDSEDGRKELYDILSNDNYDVGEYDDFVKKIYTKPQPQGYTYEEMTSAKNPFAERQSVAPEPSSAPEQNKIPTIGNAEMEVAKPIEQPQLNINIPTAPKLQSLEVEDKEYYTPAESTRKMMGEAVGNRQQVADLTSKIDNALERRGAELDTIQRSEDRAYTNIPRGTAGSIASFEAGRLLDSEYRDYATAKEAMDNAQKLIDEADANAKESNNKGLLGGFGKGAARGAKDSFFDLNTWSMGLKDASEQEALLKALDAADNDTLTPSQEALLEAKSVELATNAYFGSSVGRGYKAGSVTAQSIPFMLEMAISPASTLGKGMANRLAKYALGKYVGKKAVNKAGKYVFTRIAPRVVQGLGDVAGAGVMAGTTGAANTMADTFRRMQGDIQYRPTDEAGKVQYWQHTEGDDALTAFKKAYANTVIQNYSEMLGNYFAPVFGAAGRGATKLLDKVNLGKVNSFINDVSSSDFAKLVSDFEKYSNWNGTMGEFAEEVSGNILNSIIVGDQTFDTAEGTGVFNKENIIDTYLGVALLGGGLSAAKTMAYPLYKYDAKKAINQSKIAFDDAFTEAERINLDKAFNSDDSRVAGEALRDIVFNDNYTEEQKRAAANYAKTIQQFKGAKLYGEKKFTDGTTNPIQVEVEQAYDEGRTMDNQQDLADVNKTLEFYEKDIRDLYGASEDENVSELLGDNPYRVIEDYLDESSVNYDPSAAKRVLDYVNVRAKYDGIIGATRDRIEEAAIKAGAIIDKRKSTDDGLIHPAKMKLNDREVYIHSGGIALLDDGSIDREKSAKDIIIIDAQTGKAEFATPADLLSVDAVIDPEVEKQTIRNEIAEAEIAQLEAKMNDIKPFNINDEYSILDDQGVQHIVKVVADNGDGTIQMVVDNEAQPTTATKEMVQQMANAYNDQRAQTIIQARNEALQGEKMAQEAEQVVEQPAAVVEQAAEEMQTPIEEAQPAPRVVPMQKDGVTPDFNAMDAEMFVDEYVSRFGEDSAVKIAKNNIASARKEIEQINKSIDAVSDPNKMQALFDKKQTAEASLNRYADILSRLGGTDNETETEEKSRLRNEAGNRIAQMFPEGLPNVESFILADIATGNRIRWSDKVTNGAVTSRGLGSELGYTEAERRKRLPLIGKDAMTPEEYAESLRERLDAVGIRYDESLLRDAVLSAYQGVDSRKSAWDALESLAKRGQEQEYDTDWEDMQAQRAYEQTTDEGAQELPEMPDLATMEEQTPISEGENAAVETQLRAKEQADYDAMMDENEGEFISKYKNLSKSEADAVLESMKKDAEVEPATIELTPENWTAEFGDNGIISTPIGDVKMGEGQYLKLMQRKREKYFGLIKPTLSNPDIVLEEYDPADGAERDTKLLFVKTFIKEDGRRYMHFESVTVQKQSKEVSISSHEVNETDLKKKMHNNNVVHLKDSFFDSEGRLIEPQSEGSDLVPTPNASSESKDTTSEPKSQEIDEKISQEEETVNVTPTKAQKKAGNYKKGHITLDGFDITIEQPKGSTRSGTDANGDKWSVVMNNTYGYIRGTEGVDGDHIDMFLSDNIGNWEGEVFVVDQINTDGSFDEHKVMYGFNSIQEAQQAYLSNYSEGWQGLGAITGISKDEFKKWIASSHRKTKPFAEYKSVKTTEGQAVNTTDSASLAEDEQILFRNVYHGSGAEFDKFDHSFIGTGEGNQSFGWGTYVTEDENSARAYAQIHPLFYNKRLELSKLRREQSKLSENIPFLKGKALKKATQELEKIKKALTSLSNEANRYLYSVEIPDNDGTNYLEYGKPLSKTQLDSIKQALYNRLAASTYKGAEQELKEELDDVFAIEKELDGGEIYGTIGTYLGSDKAASEFLNKNGYVGISYPADGGNAGDARNYVIFNEADLDISDSVRFRSAEPAPVFYSNAEYAVKAVKQEKATPEQWLKMIEKNGGLKAGEDKWLGLSDWLKSSDKKTLTKQEVLDFIKENQIQIEEVEYGNGIFSRNSKLNLESELKAAISNGHRVESALSRWDAEFGDNKLALYERGFFSIDENGNIHTDEPILNHINNTRLEYTTLGLDNKREIALTVPTIESWNASDQIHFGDAGNGRAVAWVRFGETTVETDETIAARKNVDDYLAKMRDKYNVQVGEETDAMNGDEIEHLQGLTAKEVDSLDRKVRVLVIDEIQSKRHQAGRDEGYKDEAAYRKAKEELDNKAQELFERRKALIKTLEDKYGSSMYNYLKSVEVAPWVTRLVPNEEVMTSEEIQEFNETAQDAIIQQEAELKKRYLEGIPSAPFEKNWAELAMKRMLRFAAENGFDKVAWTTGEQQAERYDISKSVDNIKSEDNNVEETSDGTLIVKNITIYAGGSVHNLFVDANGVVRGREYDGKKLSDIVGKPLAEKLMEQGDFELEGDGLRIGGEGMKTFYDQMIPSFMNKYGKKWGVKVGEVTMPNLEENNTMHSIDVTDAMRESVMQGQPMFRLSDKAQTKLAGWYDDIAERYNVQGNIQVAPSREVFEQTLRDNGVSEDKLAEYDKAAYIPDKDMYLIDGEGIKDDIAAERAIFHEVWHKLRKDVITLSELEWLAKSIGSNRLQALNEAFWNGKYETDEAIVDELLSVSIEPYIEATVDVNGEAMSAFEAYLGNHISLNEATDAAKANMTDEANEFSDVFDKIFFETKRTLIAYKNHYYGKAKNRIPERGGKDTQPSTKQVLEDRPIQTAGVRGGTYTKGTEGTRTSRAEQRQRAIIAEANDLASSLGVKMTIIEDVNDITDSNKKRQRQKRGSKAWYNITTDEVVFVAPNATSVFDAMQSVWHEVVAHKGLRDVVGREKFDAFLMKVFNAADTNTRSKIVALAAKNGWDFKLATEEYMADLAEEGFDKRENRDFWQKVRDLFMDMLREAKIILGYEINDNDLRYMLWRTYQKQRKQGAMAVAEDVVMQQKMGVGNFRTRQMSERAQIVADAKANGTYLKAPNGNDTNLTPKQWAQVRTKAFKEWFGDWEKAARIEKLHKSKDANITGKEIESSEDLKQYRKNAQEYGKTLRGEYVNADTGNSIILNKDSLKEVLHHDGSNIAHIQSIAAIPQMIENGIYITSESVEENASKRLRNTKSVHYYVCGLKIGNTPYTVKFVIAEYANGERYYDHSLTQIEKGDLLNRAELSSTVAESKSPISHIKDKRLISILQTNSSKVVDANGEPKVVWHGGDFAMGDYIPKGAMHFGSFDAAKTRLNDKLYGAEISVEKNADGKFEWKYEDLDYEEYNTQGDRAFSTENEAYRDAFSKINYLLNPYFLNIRNIERTNDAGTEWDDSIEATKEKGYDGVVYENQYEDKGSDSYIAFNPNQIKSAEAVTYDNNGDVISPFERFSKDNPDIRFRGTKEAKPSGVARQMYDHAVRKRIEGKNNVGRTENLLHHLQESYQDSMLSVKDLQKAVLAETGNKLRDFEDVYKAENRLSSANKAQIEAWERDYMKPLQREVLALIKEGVSYNDIIDYLLAKHGIERNIIFAERDARELADNWEKKRLDGASKAYQYEEKRINGSYGGKVAALRKSLDTGAISQEQFDEEAKKLEVQRNKSIDNLVSKYERLKKKIQADKPEMFEKALAKNKDKDYSGLTELTGEDKMFNEAAQDMVYDFEEKHDTSGLWGAINAATKASLQKSYDSGMMNKETYDKVSKMFKYYIPLRGWDNNIAADQYEYMADKGMKILPTLKTAKGRTSRADDPIATLFSVGESSIIQGNRNLMKLRLLNFAQNNPTSLLTVSEQWYEQKTDGTWVMSNPSIPENASADEVDKIVKEHEERMKSLGDKATKKRQGLNLDLHTTYWEREEHAVNVKRNGKEYKIFVNGNPVAAQAINGFTNPDAKDGELKKAAMWVKNFMARAFTSKNPAFIFTNLGRDLIWAGTSVAIKENGEYVRQYTKNIGEAMLTAQLPRLINKWKKGTLDMNVPLERYFNEFITNGGETGFTQLNTVDDYKQNIERFIKEAQGGSINKAKKANRWLWDNIEFLNRSAEDTTRFMVYMTSRQMGRSISESVANAKDITVNFNKKGRGGFGATTMNFAYIFFNATIQSLANFGKLIANHPKKTAAALSAFASTGFIAPMIALTLQAMFSDDDDEPTYWDLPEWVRRNNIVIWVGGQGYVTIPLPHELRPFYGMGELALSTLMGKEDAEVALGKAVKGFAGLMPFDFTGNDGNVIVNLTPTIGQPFAQLVVNKDYFGVPIYRRNDYNTLDPDWTKAYKSTNQYLVDATAFVNELTGGDEVKSGMIDINPAIVEHLFESYLGGMGKTLNRTAKTFSMLWDEDAREWRNVPVLSNLYQVSNDRTSGSQINREYENAVNEAEKIDHYYQGYKKRANMGVTEYAEKLNELVNSEAFKRYQKIHSYQTAIEKLYGALKQVDKTDREQIETTIMNLKVEMLDQLKEFEQSNK